MKEVGGSQRRLAACARRGSELQQCMDYRGGYACPLWAQAGTLHNSRVLPPPRFPSFHILVLLVMTAGEKRETRQIWVQLTPRHSSGQNVSQIVNMSTCGACRRICPLGQGNKGARRPVSKLMPNLLSLIQSPTGHLQAQVKSRCFRQKWPLCP